MMDNKKLRAAVFLDRDGTINEDRGYIGDPDNIVLIEGAAEAVKELNRRDIPVIVITNQSGLARGFYTSADLLAVNNQMKTLLHAKGAHIDGLYFCPHHPEDNCECRKPETGLLLKAAHEHGIDLAQSVIIGDKVSDMELGTRANMVKVLVLTGYGPIALEELRAGSGGAEEEAGAGRGLLDQDFVAHDLGDAVEWILSEDGPFGGLNKK